MICLVQTLVSLQFLSLDLFLKALNFLTLTVSFILPFTNSISLAFSCNISLIHLFFATACQVHYRSLRKIILKNGTSKKFFLLQTKNPTKSKKSFQIIPLEGGPSKERVLRKFTMMNPW